MAPLVDSAYTLAADAAAVEAVRALRAAGIEPVLLKGRTIRDRLYRDGGPRHYVDSDLLVSPEDVARAEGALAERGFRPAIDETLVPDWQLHGRAWARGSAYVDLHWTLPGAGAPPERVWEVLAGQRESTNVGDVTVSALGDAGIALLAALRAAQDGQASAKAMEDLRRALVVLPAEAWRRAASLAEEVRAQEAMGGGLRLEPAGAALADRLALPTSRSSILALHLDSAPGAALGLEKLARTPGFRTRAELVARALVPPPAHLRCFKPLARRGRLGLAAAYLLRPFDLARQLPGACRAWRRARRQTAVT